MLSDLAIFTIGTRIFTYIVLLGLGLYRRIPQAAPFTCRAVAQQLETQNQKEDQISIRTTPDNAESEVFSDSRRFFHDFFLEKVTLYGEVAIKSR